MYMWLSLQSLWILNRPLVGLILLHPCTWERKTMNGSVYANYELKQHLFLLPVSFHKCPVELKIITCLANFEHIFKKFSTSAVPICFRKSSSVQTKECYVTLYTWVKASFINHIKFIYKIVHALCHSKLSGHIYRHCKSSFFNRCCNMSSFSCCFWYVTRHVTQSIQILMKKLMILHVLGKMTLVQVAFRLQRS